jgi:hypothetical protein
MSRPAGAGVYLRLRVFGRADAELTSVLTPPWPQWMRRLYELEALESSRMDLAGGEVEISAALNALRNRLNRRLGLLAWICTELENIGGWDISLDGGELIAATSADAGTVRAALEASRLNAVLPRLCEVDEAGLPVLRPLAEMGAGVPPVRP